MTVIDRIGRGIHGLKIDGREPFQIELSEADYLALEEEMAAGEGGDGWPSEVCGLPILRVQADHSAVVGRLAGHAVRASFII